MILHLTERVEQALTHLAARAGQTLEAYLTDWQEARVAEASAPAPEPEPPASVKRGRAALAVVPDQPDTSAEPDASTEGADEPVDA